MCLQERNYLPKLAPRLCAPDYNKDQFKEFKEWFHAQYTGWNVASYNTTVHVEITHITR